MTEEFNPERARKDAIESLKKAGWTVAANADTLIPYLMELGAPNRDAAKSALSMTCKILLVLEQKIKDAPVDEVGDAQVKIDRVMAKRAH